MSRRICLPTIAFLVIALAYLLPGCDDLITEYTEVTIAGHPTAEFSVDVDTGCTPLTVKFTNLSNGPHDSLFWNFGDGDTLSGEHYIIDGNDTVVNESIVNPVHTYDSAGTYDVTLTIKNSADDGEDTEFKKRCIIVGTTIADFTADTTYGCPGLEVTFTPVDYGGVTSWQWNFGDDSTSTDSNPTHVYDSIGIYSVSLTVTGGCGTKAITHDSLIEIVECPEVAFSATYPSPLDTLALFEGCAPLTVAFHDESGPPQGQAMDAWHWDFGDGQELDGDPLPTHEYTDTGIFVVTLTASSGGPGITTTDTIRVYDSTTAAFIAESPATSCYWAGRQFQVKFKSESLGRIDSLIWHFGDGDTLYNDSNPVHAYDVGVYTCSLEVYGVCGIDTMADTLVQEDFVILADLFDTVIFSITPATGTLETTFTFTDESPGIILSRQWIIDPLGDSLVFDNDLEVLQTFADTGWHYISLTISNNCDTAQVSDSVYVAEP